MARDRRRLLAWLPVGLLVGLLAGCGKKGDLRLPDGSPTARAEPADEEDE